MCVDVHREILIFLQNCSNRIVALQIRLWWKVAVVSAGSAIEQSRRSRQVSVSPILFQSSLTFRRITLRIFCINAYTLDISRELAVCIRIHQQLASSQHVLLQLSILECWISVRVWNALFPFTNVWEPTRISRCTAFIFA